MKIKTIFFLSCAPFVAHSATVTSAYPEDQALYDKYPWEATYYYGITGSDALARIVKGQFHRYPEHIQSLEMAHTFEKCGFIRRFFNPLVGVVQLAGNFTYRVGANESKIYEFDPYLMFRWANLPWNKHLNTSFSIGEGISYASSYIALEKNHNGDTKRLLNYLMLEMTIAPPEYPRAQCVFRIHHRSGAYGLYHAGNTGSNDVGIGLRYLFD